MEKNMSLKSILGALVVSAYLPVYVMADSLCKTPPPEKHPNVYVYDNKTPSTTASLSDISWLEGHWVGCFEGGITEFVVLSEAHTHMPGYARGYDGKKIWFYEITAFAEEDKSINFMVKHFDERFSSSEGQHGYKKHPLLEISPGLAFFDRHTFAKKKGDVMDLFYRFPDGDRAGDVTHIRYTKRP